MTGIETRWTLEKDGSETLLITCSRCSRELDTTMIWLYPDGTARCFQCGGKHINLIGKAVKNEAL